MQQIQKQELVLILQRKLRLFKHLKKEEHLTRGVPPISGGSLGAGGGAAHVEGWELSTVLKIIKVPSLRGAERAWQGGQTVGRIRVTIHSKTRHQSKR
jgi:hypothetical protein